ncbi:MBL fold metallo-hydrolase [Aestuariivirga sp.]|uniref:MBL fold metallo-hydrolase n=1 Tax=Aestuariivirga sp. TaxID=2650926 RepID=UPI003919173A
MSRRLAVARQWYEIAEVGPGVSRILETHVASWMRCNMWLVRGRNRDILIDSGMGLRPLKAEIAALRERPVTSVTTHCHFDHIGCTHEFDERLGHASEADIHADPDNRRTCAAPWLGAELLTALPHEGYRLEEFRITPAPLTGHLDEGDVLDLGDRHFRVFHLPGHSPGSVALYEEKTRILFSGDVIYDGQLIDTAWHSDAAAYRESMARLRELPVEIVHAGHEASFGRERLHALIDSYLRGELSMPSVESWLQGVSA